MNSGLKYDNMFNWTDGQHGQLSSYIQLAFKKTFILCFIYINQISQVVKLLLISYKGFRINLYGSCQQERDYFEVQ